MATRRKLNIHQLVTLCEVYWDDAAKLAEILEELRSRLEPEAEALFRTVSGRIHLLKTDPAAAREQPPPTQQTDAAREAPPPAASAAPPPRRRAVVIIAALAAIGIAAWLLWPHRAVPPPPPKSDAGPEIALGGVHADEGPKSPAEQTTPPSGPRRVVKDQRDTPPRSDGGGVGGGGGGASAPRPRVLERRLKDGRDAPEAGAIGEVAAAREPRDAPVDASAHSSRAAARASDRSANRDRRAESLAGAAEAGVAVDDARLTCYRSDSRAASCDAPPTTTDAPASNAVVRAPAKPGQPASSDADAPSSQPAAAATAGSGPLAAPPRPTSPGSPQGGQQATSTPPSQSRGDGGVADGGGSGNGGSASGGTSGGEPSATKSPMPPSPSEPPASPDAAVAAAPPPNCPPAPTEGRVVFIFDGSVSMGLPLDVDADLEDELDDGIRQHDAEARREYRALLAEPGPKRITRAREAFATAAADLPPKVELGLVVFQECRDIRNVGVFEAARRGAAVDYIRALVPKGRTPIAASLRRAAEMLGDGPSSIVVLTDGREFCGGDPCAAAADIKAAHPHTPVSIVDLTGEAKAECVAEITGGRSYQPDAADDLARVVTAAFRGADPLCARAAADLGQ